MDKSCMQMIREYIEGKPHGSVFAKADLAGCGSDDAIRMALSRLVGEGFCVRILPSVYFRPVEAEVVGEFGAPDTCEVGKAIARNYGWMVVPGPELARKELGLSMEIPEQVVLTSTGPSREYRIDGCGDIVFRQCRARFLREMSEESATVVNALMGMKDNGLLEDDWRKMGIGLSDEIKRRLLEEQVLAPKWMQPYLEIIGKV